MKRATWSGFLFCLVACGALRENPIEGTPQPDATAPVPDSEAPLVDSGTTDAAVPPIREDSACTGPNAWFQVGRSAECSQRSLRTVQAIPEDAITSNGHLALAWSPSGRLGIVLTWLDDIEDGYLQALTFDTATPDFTVRQDVVRPPSDRQIEGEGAKIAARADGTFEVLSMRAEESAGGDVLLRTLPPLQPFTEPTLVFAAGLPRSSLGLVVHRDGAATATATLAEGVDCAIVTRRRQPQALEFDAPLLSVFRSFLPAPDSSAGHSMALDPYGGLHLVYEMGINQVSSQPRYGRLLPDRWDNYRTVDNNVPVGQSGSSISLFVAHDEKNAVYFSQAKDENDKALPVADLVRARWRSLNEDIRHTVLATDFYVDRNHERTNIRAKAASATDDTGALHVVYSRQTVVDGGSDTCQISYLHEGMVKGELQVLDDVLSDVFSCVNGVPPVALAVEPGGRPHIAYLHPEQGVVYATRYDR